jgi:flavin reductase (DIM6/NTAB) family NADH-FMN oxidoreductase RutF
LSKITGHIESSVQEDERPVELPAGFDSADGVEPDVELARWLRRRLPAGVAVVTTSDPDQYFGVTVSAFSYVSLEPVLVYIALGIESQTGERIQAAGCFGISVLTNASRFTADRFAGRAPLADRHFADIPHVVARTGSPVLTESMYWLDCELVSSESCGDHIVYVGRVLASGRGAGSDDDPMLYFDSSYRRLGR